MAVFFIGLLLTTLPINFKADIKTLAIQKAEKVCWENNFASGFSVIKTEWGSSAKKSIALIIQCSGKK